MRIHVVCDLKVQKDIPYKMILSNFRYSVALILIKLCLASC